MDHGVDAKAGHIRMLIDGVDQVFVFVDRLQAIGLGRGLGPAGAARGRGERKIRIGIDRRQIEFQLRRHHRPPALGAIEGQHVLEHLARRGSPRAAVRMVGVGENIGGGRLEARRDAQGRRVGLEHHIRVAVGLVVVIGPGVFAGHGHGEDAAGQAQGPVPIRLDELGRRQHLAAQHAVHVGDEALNLGDPPFLDPAFQFRHACSCDHSLERDLDHACAL